jgi:hypothetical protein
MQNLTFRTAIMAFFSIFKLYKKGTAQVVAWLGKTAAKDGYELHPTANFCAREGG